jgi:hypothetical protein
MGKIKGLFLLAVLASCGCSNQNSSQVSSSSTSNTASSTSNTVQGQLVVDPTPSGITPSPQYTVQLTQNSQSLNSVVYQVQNPAFLANGQPSGIVTSSSLEHATSWTSFSFSGSVTVQVTNTVAFTSARVLPSHAHINTTVTANTVTFSISQPGQYAVEFCPTGSTCTEENDTNLTNPMLVFANPIETNIPSPTAANVLSVQPGVSVTSGGSPLQLASGQDTFYFGPGIYDLGLVPLTISSNQSIYLAAGAYVKGFLEIAKSSTNASIFGRGILSGENLQKAQCAGQTPGCPNMITGEFGSTNAVVEGLTLIQSPWYNVAMTGGNGDTIKNVKVIAWYGNTDGLQVSWGSQDTGSVIENSFVKNGDDSIHLDSSNLVVKNCVVWKLNNAAAFQLGYNTPFNLTNITVQDSDVIRSEYSWPNASNAIFAADFGGSGNLSNYLFSDIRVENSSWQLFKIRVSPNGVETTPHLGSIRTMLFQNIQVTDAQEFQSVFRGYNLAHPVAGVTFDNVVVANTLLPSPNVSVDANRAQSYAGDLSADILWRNQAQPTSFQFALFSPRDFATPASTPFASSTLTIEQPELTSDYVIEGDGDFYGDGFASPVFTRRSTGQIGFWKEPGGSDGGLYSVYTLQSADGAFAGVGDFNGDGYSDILLWNASTQTGTVLLVPGGLVVGKQTFQPTTASNWSVAAVADFDANGYSDVLLRDPTGNIEIVYFAGGSPLVTSTADFPATDLYYNSTSNYTATYGATSGHFDSTWSVIDAGIFQTLGTSYAGILWENTSTGQLGITNFTPFQKAKQFGQVFAKLPVNTNVEFVGDFFGNSSKNLILLDTATQQNSLWNLDWFGGTLFQVGPSLQSPLPSTGWQGLAN